MEALNGREGGGVPGEAQPEQRGVSPQQERGRKAQLGSWFGCLLQLLQRARGRG